MWRGDFEVRKWLPEPDADRTAQVAIVDSFRIKVSRLAKGKKGIAFD